MGFFSDLKDDLSQAVNEFMPENGSGEDSSLDDASFEETITDADLESLKSELDLDGDLDLGDGLGGDLGEVSEMSADANAAESEDSAASSDTNFDDDLADILDGLDDTYEKAKSATLESVPAPENAPAPQYTAEEPAKASSFISPAPVSNTRVASDEVSSIMESMIINGNMATEGSLEIKGSVVGNVEALGKLNITGSIQGNSSASEIFADGAKITGDVKSMGAIKIGQSTTIIGNVFATSAVVAGAIKGDIDVKGPVILDSTAIVLGNIKSKAVQINNGAVIEGMCSQCYAEVNPISFFEELKKMK